MAIRSDSTESEALWNQLKLLQAKRVDWVTALY